MQYWSLYQTTACGDKKSNTAVARNATFQSSLLDILAPLVSPTSHDIQLPLPGFNTWKDTEFHSVQLFVSNEHLGKNNDDELSNAIN